MRVCKHGCDVTLSVSPGTIDSSTSTTTSFSNKQRVRAREPVSFWRENVIAVVILLRVFVRIS